MTNPLKTLPMLLCYALASCALDAGEEAEPDDPFTTVTRAQTGSNPKQDAEYVGDLLATCGHNCAAGVGYRDLAIDFVGNANYKPLIYAVRTDGIVEIRAIAPMAGLVHLGNVGQPTPALWNRATWVYGGPPNSAWGLIGARDSERNIYRNINPTTGTGTLMGSYPAGINSLGPMVGFASGSDLILYVVHGKQPHFVTAVVRRGLYQTSTGRITWDADTSAKDWGYYNKGLARAPAPGSSEPAPHTLFSISDYISSSFVYNVYSAPKIEQVFLSTYSEHAYLQPDGHLDRFAPAGLAYEPGPGNSYGFFWGVDWFRNSFTGDTSWVLARIRRNKLTQ